MSKCLVTGGLGFIGSNVVDVLIEAGHEVTIVDNLSTGKVENFNPKAGLIKADIRDSFEEWPKVDYVFHLAALARIPRSIEEPLETHTVNVVGTLNVLDYCRKIGAKVIFSGSSSIYEGKHLPTREDAPKAPQNPYALQKLECEQYIELYNQLYNIDYCILRYFNVYGERQLTEGAYAAVVGIFLDQKSRGKALTITNDGEQRRDFTYVKDVATANIMAMDWSGTINIGAGHNYSVNDIAERVGGEKDYIGERQNEVQATLADNGKARDLGWKPTMDILEWIDANKD